MQTAVKSFIKLMTRRSRNGQALVIVAFAMLALIAFVGIAVDTAMLFARYSALRRAVDAAAIAAASHVNQNTTYASLQSIAVQYIRLHGLDPSSVLVETCETEIDEFVGTHTAVAGINNTNAPLSTILAYANTPPPYGTPINGVAMNFPSELCKASPVKILRVSAQLQSPTSFLSLLGWKTITLVSSSLAQTAVLDVALLLDTSPSESFDTASAETSQGQNFNQPASSGKATYNASYPCKATGTTTDGYGAPSGTFCTMPGLPPNKVGSLWNVCQPGVDNLPLPVADIDPSLFVGAGPANPPTCTYNNNSAVVQSLNYFGLPGGDLKDTNIVALANFRDFTDTSNDPAYALQYTSPYGYTWPGQMVGDVPNNHNIPGLGLTPYGQDADGTGYIDPSKAADINFLPTTVTYNGVTLTPNQVGSPANQNTNHSTPLAVRPECYLGSGASAQIANYAWAGCCDDPTLQSNNSTESTNGVSSGVDNAWGNDPNWYVCDPTDLNQQSIIATNGSQPQGGDCGIAPGPGTAAKVVGTQAKETRNAIPLVAPSGYGYPITTANYGVTTQANASVATANNPTGRGMLYQGGDGNYSDLVCQPFKQVRDAARRFIKKLDFVRGDRLMIINFDVSAHEVYPFDPAPPPQSDPAADYR